MLEIGDKFIISDLFKRIEKLYPTHKLLDIETKDKGYKMEIKTFYKNKPMHKIEVLKDGVLFEVTKLTIL